MNLSALIISIQEIIFEMKVKREIINLKNCSNELTTRLTKLFEDYSLHGMNKTILIDDDLKRISQLLRYLKKCIYILEYKKYNNWSGFRYNYPLHATNRVKVIFQEVQDLCVIIDNDLMLCKKIICKCSKYELKRACSL
jgi:hypothetical protein